jgi:monoamine oxidase
MAHTSLATLFTKAYGQIQRSRRCGMPLAELVEQEAERSRQRRAFLRGAAAVGASLALPAFAQAGDTVDALVALRRQPRVAIIGGGMAGLTCAYRLKQKGVIATVYEASKRTGGRMYSDTTTFGYAGQTCELGGELIDTGHTTMRRMAREFGLTLEGRDSDQVGLRDLPSTIRCSISPTSISASPTTTPMAARRSTPSRLRRGSTAKACPASDASSSPWPTSSSGASMRMS